MVVPAAPTAGARNHRGRIRVPRAYSAPTGPRPRAVPAPGCYYSLGLYRRDAHARGAPRVGSRRPSAVARRRRPCRRPVGVRRGRRVTRRGGLRPSLIIGAFSQYIIYRLNLRRCGVCGLLSASLLVHTGLCWPLVVTEIPRCRARGRLESILPACVRVPWRRLSVYGVNSPVHAFYVYSTTARGAVFSPPSSESSSSESTVLAGAHERLVLAHISAQSRASGGRMTDIEDGPPFITFHLVCTTSTTACERQPGYTAGA